jgi:DNA-binding beta-propeller fold protein YncE
VSPDGKSVYVANVGDSTISQFNIGATGKLSPKSPAKVAAGSGSVPGFSFTISPDGKSVYVANTSVVLQFNVTRHGRLAPKSPPSVSPGGRPVGVAVSPDGRHAYVTRESAGEVTQYNIGKSGRLVATSAVSVPAGMGAESPAVNPSGRNLYVTGLFGGTVSQFDIGAKGRLSPKSPASLGGLTLPQALAVSPDGRSVYITNSGSGAIPGTAGQVSQFSVTASGALSPKSPATAPAGAQPTNVAVTPDAQHVYVTSAGTNAISRFSVGPGGALSPGSPASVPTGAGPAGLAITPPPAPILKYLTMSHRRFAVSRRVTAVAARPRPPRGSAFRYTLNENALVTITIVRLPPGQPFSQVGTLKRTSHGGINSFPFSGRIGRRALAPGLYRATLVARDRNRKTSRARTITFTIVAAA